MHRKKIVLKNFVLSVERFCMADKKNALLEFFLALVFLFLYIRRALI